MIRVINLANLDNIRVFSEENHLSNLSMFILVYK